MRDAINSDHLNVESMLLRGLATFLCKREKQQRTHTKRRSNLHGSNVTSGNGMNSVGAKK